ncbi:ATP-binding protein [Streptomyces sp. KHY 26]|uniref:ATP-binding protein n=1 Tax=Streptomyces sp. KHY 26 TaxID=3097359 RepID=UPI00376F3C57
MPVTESSDSRLRCVLPFEAAPEEVGLLRRAAAKQLDRWGVPVASDEAEVVITELATNVVKHVGEGVSATLVLEWKIDRLRVELHDRCPALPSPRGADCYEECGRGLHLVAGLAVDWGWARTTAGKMVWCEVALREGAVVRYIERAAMALERYRGAESDADRHGRVQGVGLEESAVELIADLLHWTAARGHDPDDILDRAQMRYESQAGAA